MLQRELRNSQQTIKERERGWDVAEKIASQEINDHEEQKEELRNNLTASQNECGAARTERDHALNDLQKTNKWHQQAMAAARKLRQQLNDSNRELTELKENYHERGNDLTIANQEKNHLQQIIDRAQTILGEPDLNNLPNLPPNKTLRQLIVDFATANTNWQNEKTRADTYERDILQEFNINDINV